MRERIRYDLLMKLFGTSLSLRFMREKYGPFYLLWIWKELLLALVFGVAKMREGRLHLRMEKVYYLVVLMREFFASVNQFRAICTEEMR